MSAHDAELEKEVDLVYGLSGSSDSWKAGTEKMLESLKTVGQNSGVISSIESLVKVSGRVVTSKGSKIGTDF